MTAADWLTVATYVVVIACEAFGRLVDRRLIRAQRVLIDTMAEALAIDAQVDEVTG